jgi:DNA polymerase-3 subunit beta
MIDQTKFAMAVEEIRYNLNGICFHVLESEGRLVLRTVATDLHRLACRETQAPEEARSMPEIIVGRKTIQEARKLLDEAGAFVEIGVSQNRIEFVVHNDDYHAVFGSRLIDGSFPDYQSAINVDNDKNLIVPRKDFAEALDRVGTVVNDKERAVKISLSSNMATISAVSSEFGSAREELDVDYPYEESIDLCFNVRYVLDVASQISEDEMQFMIADGNAPAIVKPLNRSDALFVLMPLLI